MPQRVGARCLPDLRGGHSQPDKTERRIFDGYAAGLRSREIVEQLDIKDSTLRFHNKNIYEKLGVSSLKQLQQFVAILNSGSGSAPDSAPDEK